MKQLHVAIGIIRNIRQEIFLTKRASTGYMADKWEFPGGKIEASESPEAGLKRELFEETGITVIEAELIQRLEDKTNAKLVLTLHFFLVKHWQGEPWGKEGQPSRWVPQANLVWQEFPPANQPIITQLIANKI